MRKEKVTIGIIGGSGFYRFLEGKEISVSTPYGKPSDKILISEYAGKKIAFLPRHGKLHQYPPHKIPYRANLYALKKIGVERIIAPCACGSLKPGIKPGHFVVCDQFVDRTRDRQDTFFDGLKVVGQSKEQGFALRSLGEGRVVHLSMAQPYCPELRQLAIESCQKLNLHGHIRMSRTIGESRARLKTEFVCHKKGTMVVINGPRFSTTAESRFYTKMGWDVIGMTQYPEVVLARELEMCYVTIALITDYDVGLKGNKNIKPVTAAEVVRVFKQNNRKVKKLILEMLKNMPKRRNCSCGRALKDAEM